MSETIYYAGGEERAPRAFVFADGPDAIQSNTAALAAVGTELDAVYSLDQLNDRLNRQLAARTILVDFGESDDTVETTVASIERFAEATGATAIASAPLNLIDRLSASVTSERVAILCQPTLADRISELMLTRDRAEARVNESAELDSLRLRRLADEVNRIARALTSLSATGDNFGSREPYHAERDRAEVGDVKVGFAAEPAQTIMPPAGEVRAILRLRRLRESFFDPDLFADPAWDMLLDLLAAKIEGDQVAVSSLCIAAAVPPTTALRWIKTMTDARLLERHADPMDGRRIFIRLTENAANALGRYFAAARRQGGMLI